MARPEALPASALDLHRLFQAHYDRIWRLLRSLRLPSDRLDDAAQQVFLIFTERRADVLPGRETSFLFGTALRVAQTIRRQCHREVPTELELAAPNLPGTDELTDQKRARQVLDLMLDQMEPELREIFVLYEIEGFTMPEIAEMQELALGTAASRLRRARERFQTLVKLYAARPRNRKQGAR